MQFVWYVPKGMFVYLKQDLNFSPSLHYSWTIPVPQWNLEILIRGCLAGSDPQRNVAFHLLENEFENVKLTHGTRLGMDGKALGETLISLKII